MGKKSVFLSQVSMLAVLGLFLGVTAQPVRAASPDHPVQTAPSSVAASGGNEFGSRRLAAYGPAAPGAAHAANPVCDASLLAYWKLDELAGPTYTDSVGGHTASGCAGDSCPFPIAGKVNGGQRFSEAENDGLTVESSPVFDWAAGASFSIETWMNSGVCEMHSEVAIGRPNGGVLSNPSWWLGCKASNGYAYFELLANSTTGVRLTSSVKINDGNWHHLVAVRDGAAGTTRLYVDGVERANETFTFTSGFASTQKLNLGWYEDPVYNFRVSGDIDEVAIYGKALSATEITKHYREGTGRSYCNNPPSVTNPGTQNSQEGAAVSLQIHAQDPDGSSLTYAASNLPPGLSINPASGLISGVVADNAADNSPYYIVSLTVVDQDAPAATSEPVTFVWNVSNPSDRSTKLYLPQVLRAGP